MSQTNEVMEMFGLILVGILMLTVIIVLIASIIVSAVRKSPFEYPYYVVTYDVSGKRLPDINDYIDEHLIAYGLNEFSQHCKKVSRWKVDCQKRIANSKLQKLRSRQYEEAIDDDNMFRFELVRKETRYQQENYVKSSYYVYSKIAEASYDFDGLKQRYDALAEIDFECTLSEYNSAEQRKRMTPALREQIAKRDNYTCQMCGKYMPDGVGLHIDHIIPIKKGGKSIPSNLQVLCSKCNGKKSSK